MQPVLIFSFGRMLSLFARSFGKNTWKWNHKAYFLSTLIVLLFSFTAILRAIAGSADQTENLLDDDDLRFSIQIFSCWDYKIANQETADIKIASIATSIREAILEDQERGRKQEQNSWSTRILRILGLESTTHNLWLIAYDWVISNKLWIPIANILVGFFLIGSGYIIYDIVIVSKYKMLWLVSIFSNSFVLLKNTGDITLL